MTKLSWFETYEEDNYYGLDMSKLALDDCYIVLRNVGVSLLRRHKECVECPFIGPVEMIRENLTILRKASSYDYRAVSNGEDPSNYICDIQNDYDDFGEFGIYELETSKSGCLLTEVNEPVNTTFPILTVFLIYFALFSALYLIKRFVFNKYFENWKTKDVKMPEKERLKSLDAFRGISIVVMIFVNYGAGGYNFFDHAAWNGLHLADLVFPWFMWIMGVCIPISLASSFKRKTSNGKIILNVMKRSLKLFAVGILLGSGINLQYLRIFGVLQRFAITYFVVSIILIGLIDRSRLKSKDVTETRAMFEDFTTLMMPWAAIMAISLVYCLVIFLASNSDCPARYFGPGGLHENAEHMNCTGGITGYIDRWILRNHAYRWSTINEVYYPNQFFDPEGIFATLPSIIHVFIGAQAGIIVIIYKTHKDRLIRWCLWSIFTGILGGALCGFSKEDGVIPVNKNLWSLSFVFTTCCFAFVLLSICYVLIDLKKWWTGEPFFYAGMNSIFLYIGHSLMEDKFPVRWSDNVIDPGFDHYSNVRTHFTFMLENVWATSVWVLVSYYLYKIKYFFVI